MGNNLKRLITNFLSKVGKFSPFALFSEIWALTNTLLVQAGTRFTNSSTSPLKCFSAIKIFKKRDDIVEMIHVNKLGLWMDLGMNNDLLTQPKWLV